MSFEQKLWIDFLLCTCPLGSFDSICNCHLLSYNQLSTFTFALISIWVESIFFGLPVLCKFKQAATLSAMIHAHIVNWRHVSWNHKHLVKDRPFGDRIERVDSVDSETDWGALGGCGILRNLNTVHVIFQREIVHHGTFRVWGDIFFCPKPPVDNLHKVFGQKIRRSVMNTFKPLAVELGVQISRRSHEKRLLNI